MHICLHDFAGHPFQAELARELAKRGHTVSHLWFAGDSGPKGQLRQLEGDSERLSFVPIGKNINYSKTNLLKRRQGDISYGREVSHWISKHTPDVVISGNTPTEAQEDLQRSCIKNRIPFIYWCQDFYSIAVSHILKKKLPLFGNAVGAYYRFLERRQMRRSSQVIHIAEAFCEQTDAWGIPRSQIEVIPNWGAIDEIDELPRETEWAVEQGLLSGTRYLYTGTLALKHNPDLLAEIAKAINLQEEVVLVAAGEGADQLNHRKLQRLRCLPLQPFGIFDQVLASGDVLLAVIEKDAGLFSVPSKVLSYLCAGRPIVLSAPKNNLAAQILISTGAGKVVEPDDLEGFINAALFFRDNKEASKTAGAAGRAYAEKHFRIDTVANRFETLFLEVTK